MQDLYNFMAIMDMSTHNILLDSEKMFISAKIAIISLIFGDIM